MVLFLIGFVFLQPTVSYCDEEYNFSWLDPDKKVYVLQNRRYRKAERLGVYISGGLNLSNPFRTEYSAVPRVAFWLSEQFGFEAFYGLVSTSANATLTALRTVSASALPFVRENRGYFGGVGTWTPWYSKLNFFNKILYFDWFVHAGLGQIQTAVDENTRATGSPNYRLENLTTLFLGTGQNFFLNQHFQVRLDLIGMFYRARGADNVTTRTFSDFDFTTGLGYVF